MTPSSINNEPSTHTYSPRLALDDVVYLAGPMTGYPEFNAAAFTAAKAYLENLPRKWIITTPFDNGVPLLPLQPYGAYFKADLTLMQRATMLVLLPGWTQSKGALVEVQVAAACGMPIWFLAPDGRGLVAMDRPKGH